MVAIPVTNAVKASNFYCLFIYLVFYTTIQAKL